MKEIGLDYKIGDYNQVSIRTSDVIAYIKSKEREDKLNSILKNNGFRSRVKADLGVTLDGESKKTVSVLKSGIMIIDGINSEKEAYDFYNKIIIDDMKIPSSRVE